jgi:hypothetical protein
MHKNELHNRLYVTYYKNLMEPLDNDMRDLLRRNDLYDGFFGRMYDQIVWELYPRIDHYQR